jgi:signal transduction histidine kinase
MTIPLLSQDRLMGVLFLESRRPERFTKEAFQLIQMIATRIAVAVDNAQLFTTTLQQLAELQDLYTQISRLEQLKTDMIRIAAHDLGNPLTSISGYIELLLESGLDERYRDYAQMIRDSATRMKKIIRDILSLQRIEELAQGNINETIDLNDLSRQVFDGQRFPAAHKGQILRLEVPDYQMLIQGDSAQLREAMTNLVSNAIKYTPSGGEITIYLWEENDSFIFDVVDNGYGIPEDQQDRLFQPFYRAKSQETQQIEGTGLGLHLVQNIIERHKGRMRFQSVYGQGSTFGFEFRIPMP